jgi:hypothetical protein
MNEVDIAWAAGVLEGEGSFVFRNTNSCAVTCQMTDLDILEKLQKIFGGKIYSTKKREVHWKDAWHWSIATSKDAVACMRAILPHMGNRRTKKILECIARWEDNQKNLAEWEDFKVCIAKEYLAGAGTMRALGIKYGISRTTVLNAVIKFEAV